jgi:hypothetical protein
VLVLVAALTPRLPLDSSVLAGIAVTAGDDCLQQHCCRDKPCMPIGPQSPAIMGVVSCAFAHVHRRLGQTVRQQMSFGNQLVV